MRSDAGVKEVANAVVEVMNIRLGEPKRLSVVRGKVNPNFYEDSTLTPEGERRLERLFNEGLARIQRKKERLQEEGNRIQKSEEQLKKREELFTSKVKAFEERFKQPVYNKYQNI